MNLMGLQGGLYRPLTQDQIKTIHNSALKILERTGMAYEKGLESTAKMLKAKGALIDETKQIIKFPKELVLEQIAKAPKKVVLYGQKPKNDLILTEDRVYMGTGGSAVKILDQITGDARSTTLKDLYNIAKLVDQLDNIHFLHRPCIPTDLDKDDYDINTYYACLSGTSKHVMSGVNDEKGLHDVIEMASIIANGIDKLIDKPFFSVTACFAISPLKLCTQSVLIMQEANRNNIPVALSSAPMAGSTSPLTMAGTLALLHAEELAGITICQITKNGAPLLYGGIPGMANLNTMGYLGGAVECGMMNAAIHQMARFINIPNYNSAGLTDSKIPDIQAGYEKAFTCLLASMGGSNYIHHSAGMLESMLAIAYEQYIIDDEIIGNCCKILKGIDVDEEHLSLDVIDSIGPGGNYILAEHTMDYLRKEYFFGNGVSDKNIRERWEKKGGLDARQRARQIANQMLANQKPSHLSCEIDSKIRKRFKIKNHTK